MAESQSIEEMLVEEIRGAENTSVLIVLARLCHGKISQKYDELIEAWKYKCPQLCPPIAKFAVEALLEQKQKAETEAHRRAEAEGRALYGNSHDDGDGDRDRSI